MIVPISEEFRIEGTRYAWEVQRATVRKHRKSGERHLHWAPILWYSTLPAAIEGLAELRLRVANTESLEDAVREAKRISGELGAALATVCKPVGTHEPKEARR